MKGAVVAAVLGLGQWAAAVPSSCKGATVDLEYGKYRGYHSKEYGLNIWKSIPYAAPPVGDLRWQAPQPVQPSSDGVIPAVEQPPVCPQSGAFGLPAIYGFNSGPGNEDCLYLNVYAAPDAENLPVLVWIHGGGYSLFGASYDPSVWLNTNDNGFIAVEIQYRLGAFGFLSSPEIKEHGQLNAGLLDQQFALEWVQEHIAKFGGDPSRVTIAGESSGAGSVMHHALAYGGRDSKLFNNIIAASPYAPAIYKHDHDLPTGNFDAFVNLVGCGEDSATRGEYASTFACLTAADTELLQNASGTVSETRGYYGSFAWLPVIDGSFIKKRPSQQLLQGKVAGKRLLVGSNANEGVPLTNPAIETRDAFDEFVAATFPLFTKTDKKLLKSTYKVNKAQEGDDDVRFETIGDEGPDANTQSSYATGLQQTVFNIAAETNFNCPAQWLAEAYSVSGRSAWKFQYSAAPSHHGADLSAYFAIDAEVPSADFRYAFQKIWGNFIMHNTPVISVEDATGGRDNATVPVDGNGDSIEWPKYSLVQPTMMNLNSTGGDVQLIEVTDELQYYVRVGEDIVNTFRLVDSFTWEGGRGARCAFWQAVAPRVPQ